jgi:hypothetical protein
MNARFDAHAEEELRQILGENVDNVRLGDEYWGLTPR